MPDACATCPHLNFCNLYDITIGECQDIDFDAEDIRKELRKLSSDCGDCDWYIADHKYTEGLLDYGEPVEEDD